MSDNKHEFDRKWTATEKTIDDPLRWRKASRVRLSSDLFYESVPDEWIDRIFAVMALSPQHTFQVLTKRPERMREYISQLDEFSLTETDKWYDANYRVTCDDAPNGSASWHQKTAALEDAIGSALKALRNKKPLPNVWLGVSVEDQATADERIPLLLDMPAAKRFVSAEPLLGPLDLDTIKCGTHDGTHITIEALTGFANDGENVITGIFGNPSPKLDWVIVGGESGPNARPMHPDWVRSLRDQCATAGVPFFFKQWGEWTPGENVERVSGVVPTAAWWNDRWDIGRENLAHTDGHIDDEPDLYRVGKKAAGALLDSREHREFPA